MIPSINVMLWGKPVGTLVETGSGRNRQICFYFDPAFVRCGLDIAPIRASISGVAAQKGMPIYPEKNRLFGGLPSFIADSMPDNWGHLVFSQWTKAHNISMKNITALDRLAYIGRRGMGALEFVPPMQCVEHFAAQWIANLRIQKPENAPFLPSENRFFRPSRACVFVPAKLAVLTKMCKRPIRGHYRFV